MKELADEYHSLLHRKTVHCKKDTECRVSRAYTEGNEDNYVVRNFIWVEKYYEKKEM